MSGLMRLDTEESLDLLVDVVEFVEEDITGRYDSVRKTALGAQARIDQILDSLPDLYRSEQRIHALQEAAALYRDELGDLDAALVVLQAALREDLDYPPVVEAIAELAQQTGAWNQLLSDLMNEASEREVDEPHHAARLWARVASWYMHAVGDHQGARDAVQRALALDASNLLALTIHEDVLYGYQDWDALLVALEARLAQESSTAIKRELLQRCAGLAADELGDRSRQVQYLERAHEIEPSFVAILNQLETLYREEQASSKLARILWKLAPLSTTLPRRLERELEVAFLLEDQLENPEQAAAIYNGLEDLESAMESLQRQAKAARSSSERATLHYRMGRLAHHRIDDPSRAEWFYQEALSHDPAHEASLRLLARTYESTEQWGKAVSLYERQARRGVAPHIAFGALLGAARIRRGPLADIPGALRACREACEIVPDSDDAQDLLAELLFEREDFEELDRVLQGRRHARSASDRKTTISDCTLHLMVAACARAKGNEKKALQTLVAARTSFGEDLRVLQALASCAAEMSQWTLAHECLRAMQAHPEAPTDRKAQIDLHMQLAEVHRAMQRPNAALPHIERVLQMAPRHRQALAIELELRQARGEWKAVAEAKRARLQTATDDVKAMLLADLGDLEAETFQDPRAALRSYQSALAVNPKDHRLMQRTLDAAARLGEWRVAFDMIQRFASLESEPSRKGQYLLAAAELCRDKLHESALAIDYFEQALDAFFADPQAVDEHMLPRRMKAFADLDRMFTKAKAWKEQEKAYRRMIKRLGTGHPLLSGLWKSLAEIYRSRLKQRDNAIAALEVVITLDPRDMESRNELAQLYILPGLDAIDKAIAVHHEILDMDSRRHDSYHALYELYRKQGQQRRAWHLAQALVLLEKSTAQECAFAQEHRQRSPIPPRVRLSDQDWMRLRHPLACDRISALFALTIDKLAPLRASAPRSLQLKPRHKVVIEEQHEHRMRMLRCYLEAAGVSMPQTYLCSTRAEAATAHILREKNEVAGGLALGGPYLATPDDREAAFRAGQAVCRLRPEYWLSAAVTDTRELRELLHWVIGQASGQAPAIEHPMHAELKEQSITDLRRIEELQAVLARMAKSSTVLDPASWLQGVQRSADRLGLLLCGDLPTAARCIAIEGTDDVVARVSELIHFSIGDDYFAVQLSLHGSC